MMSRVKLGLGTGSGSCLDNKSVLRVPHLDLRAKFAGYEGSVGRPEPSNMLDVSHVRGQLKIFLCHTHILANRWQAEVGLLELLSDVKDAMNGGASHCQRPHN